MILTGPAIEAAIAAGDIVIDPYIPENVGPNSVDLRLSSKLLVYVLGGGRCLDMHEDNETTALIIPQDGLILLPGTLYLGQTIEHTETPMHIPMVEGRSSVGRLGMKVHVTAGFGDVGFRGTWTLEIEVTHPLRVYAGERVCQVYFSEVRGLIRRYEGRYQDQDEPTPSRFYRD